MLTTSALRLSRPTKEFFARSFRRANYSTGSWLMFARRASRTQHHEVNRVFLSTSAAQNQQAHQKLPHFRTKKGSDEKDRTKGDEDYRMAHPIWTKKDLEGIQITHREPETFVDKLAYFLVQTFRISFDILSLYKIGKMTEAKWLNRIIMLETIAGVPGMIGGMARHLKSLRSLSRDHGWIHTLLEEAENERMHLMTALELKNPGILFKGLIIVAQGVFVNLFFLAYLISPQFCHRFVGYLEEEAVKTYTYCLECIDNGKLPVWQKMPAPQISVNYWELQEGATMRDTILAIRADEAHHRVVNHTLGTISKDAPNPFYPGQRRL